MIELRPQSKLSTNKMITFEVEEFKFSTLPLVCEPALTHEDIQDNITDYGSDIDDIDFYMEFTWYHRCRIGDDKDKVFSDYTWDQEWDELVEKANYPHDDMCDNEWFGCEHCVSTQEFDILSDRAS